MPITPTTDYLFDEAPGLEGDEAQLLERQATGLQATLDRLREQLEEIDEDPALSQEGKREKRAEAVAGLRRAAKSAGMLEKLDQLRAEVESERERLLNPAHRLQIEGEEDRATSREREIRDRLRDLRDAENGDLRVREVLTEAAREDRRLLLRAVETDPLADVDPIVGDEVLREARQTHLRIRFPDRVEALEAKERVASLMADNLNRADEVAREAAGAAFREREGDGLRVL